MIRIFIFYFFDILLIKWLSDKGSAIVTMGRLAPWMTICTFIFSIAFEKSWQMISQIDYFFDSPIDMLEGFGQLLIFYVMWTMEVRVSINLIQ